MSEIYQENKRGTLFLVPTPIGNLDDMTFRAVNTLKSVDLVLAEDTRHTRKLLNHFSIEVALDSYHEYSDQAKIDKMINYLQEGRHLALVSDAGMPIINDPGHPLVTACLQHDISLVALPGANAALTALIASGLSAETFTYYGFFPRQTKNRIEVVSQIANRNETAIFYESPHRVHALLVSLKSSLSLDTQVVLARELTKRYEEYIRGSLEEVMNQVEGRELKGEFVVLVQGGRPLDLQPKQVDKGSLKDEVERVIEQKNVSSKVAIKEVAKSLHLKKQEVYQAYHELD